MIRRSPVPPPAASPQAPARRSFLRAGARLLPGALAGVGGTWLAQPAQAHHGFAGKYDFSRPIYLAGRLTHAYIGHPHVRLTVDVPHNLQLPRDREWMRALEDAEARQTTSLLRASERRGTLDISLASRLTRRLMDEPDLLEIGDPLEAVVYRRSTRDEYRNELHAVLIALPDGRLLVASSTSVSSR